MYQSDEYYFLVYIFSTQLLTVAVLMFVSIRLYV